ncbi:CENPS-like protein [Mya arenaria]|uniref:Centromere protein S n=1 Tax=Mya arenaria TaxID=6604 RepID=A0ABY7DG71_MYAAR|nr:centromere protein S-like [Mya arenaria]WAQ96689.1 CENPS-like protein [Mya arenaria]
MTTEEDFEKLTYTQRLKAAVHHTTLQICKEHADEKNVQLNKMVVAAISETTWKKCEQFATDLELFAKHAKRSTINADDVKMLIRKTPKLLDYINGVQEELNASKPEPKKRSKKGKGKQTSVGASTSPSDQTEPVIVEEES